MIRRVLRVAFLDAAPVPELSLDFPLIGAVGRHQAQERVTPRAEAHADAIRTETFRFRISCTHDGFNVGDGIGFDFTCSEPQAVDRVARRPTV